MSSRVFRYDPKQDKVVEVTDDTPSGQPLNGGRAAYDGSAPLISEGLGCHPSMVEEYRGEAKRRGVSGVDWNEKGQAVITSRSGRAAWLKSCGRHDNDGGYGD